MAVSGGFDMDIRSEAFQIPAGGISKEVRRWAERDSVLLMAL